MNLNKEKLEQAKANAVLYIHGVLVGAFVLNRDYFISKNWLDLKRVCGLDLTQELDANDKDKLEAYTNALRNEALDLLSQAVRTFEERYNLIG